MHQTGILSRVVVRMGVALWRNRIAWLGGVLAIGALSAYSLTYAGPTVANGDCADTTMAAVAKNDDQTAHAAYACLGQSMRQSSEDTFVQSLRQRSVPTGRVSRVAEQLTRDGGRIAFFTIEAQGQTVGYIVYLGADGKVSKIE